MWWRAGQLVLLAGSYHAPPWRGEWYSAHGRAPPTLCTGARQFIQDQPGFPLGGEHLSCASPPQGEPWNELGSSTHAARVSLTYGRVAAASRKPFSLRAPGSMGAAPGSRHWAWRGMYRWEQSNSPNQQSISTTVTAMWVLEGTYAVAHLVCQFKSGTIAVLRCEIAF